MSSVEKATLKVIARVADLMRTIEANPPKGSWEDPIYRAICNLEDAYDQLCDMTNAKAGVA